jgi:hypothetical protein
MSYITIGKENSSNIDTYFDQIVPYKDASELAVKIVKHGKLKIYPGAPHGLCSTHKNKVNEDLLAFCSP